MMEVNDNSISNEISRNVKSIENLYEGERQNISLEKGNLELLLRKNDEIKDENKIAKDKLEKNDNIAKNYRSHSDYGINSYETGFNFNTLSKDLADIEERLRATRMSWNNDKNEAAEQHGRRTQSMIDVDIGKSSLYNEQYDADSPVMSEGILKWDYGADIGLRQGDSDDIEPITWPVTAEQAQKEALGDIDLDKSNLTKKMKSSLSQNSFIASPDPEDRHNLIAEAADGVGIDFYNPSPCLNGGEKDILSANNYDENSALIIMEQAEAAERRLRLRLETVKTLHSTGRTNNKFQNTNNQVNETEIGDSQDKPKDDISRKENSSDSWEPNRHASADEKSLTSNTGRTTTMESTHTCSDYCKAPVFNSDAYGTREDIIRNGSCSIYSKKKDAQRGGQLRSVCGIAPDLDTISSRETLQITEDKKDASVLSDNNNVISDAEKRGIESKTGFLLPDANVNNKSEQENVADEEAILSDTQKDKPQERGLQAKWEEFKSLAKDGFEHDLYEATTIRTPHQFQLPLFNKDIQVGGMVNSGGGGTGGSTNRQYSAATTFTTVTNMSPRHDSFDTDYCQYSPLHKNNMPLVDSDGQQKKTDKSYSKIRRESDKENQYRTRYSIENNYSPTRKKIGGGNDDGGDDDDDDDDPVSQTEKRKERHNAAAMAYKKLPKKKGYKSQNKVKGKLHDMDAETTASELEHDDNKDELRQLNKRDEKAKRLSKLLSQMSKRAMLEGNSDSVVRDDGQEENESTSVDTVMLMDRMAGLLGRKEKKDVLEKLQTGDKDKKQQVKKDVQPSKKDVQPSKKDVQSLKKEIQQSKKNVQPSKKEVPQYEDMNVYNPKQHASNRRIPGVKTITGDESNLILKHLLLKHKVKWLADCAREESRRRKIKRLERLLDFHENGGRVKIPEELDTDTASLFGSERGSLADVNSMSESMCYTIPQGDDGLAVEEYENGVLTESEVTPKHLINKSNANSGQCRNLLNYNESNVRSNINGHTLQQTLAPSSRQQYADYKRSGQGKPPSKKYIPPVYPPSETWHVPLKSSGRDNDIGYENYENYENYDCYGDRTPVPNDCYDNWSTQHPDAAAQQYYADTNQQLSYRNSHYPRYGLSERQSHPQPQPQSQHQYDQQNQQYQQTHNYNQHRNHRLRNHCQQHPQSNSRQRYYTPNSSDRLECQQQHINGITKKITPRERIQIMREAELARQRNAYECEKDVRQTRSGMTKVGNGGLAWEVGLNGSIYMNGFQAKDKYNDDNVKEKIDYKSELQKAFEEKMNSFISRSRQRQKRIQLAADERRYQTEMNQQRAKLFANSVSPLMRSAAGNVISENGYSSGSGSFRRRRPVTQPDPLSDSNNEDQPKSPGQTRFVPKLNLETNSRPLSSRQAAENLYKPQPRKLSRSEMIHTSARKYKVLPEVQQRYSEESKKARIQLNRMKMMQYGEKILSRVLRNRGPWIPEKV